MKGAFGEVLLLAEVERRYGARKAVCTYYGCPCRDDARVECFREKREREEREKREREEREERARQWTMTPQKRERERGRRECSIC